MAAGAVPWKSGRTSFGFAGVLNWFPGHMAKATRLMRERLSGGGVDVVLEVRDARVPFSATNVVLESVLTHRRIARLLVLHKADLTSPQLLSVCWCPPPHALVCSPRNNKQTKESV